MYHTKHVLNGNFFFVLINLMSLLLIGKPKLNKLPSVKIADVDSTPELVCRASGWPVPRVSWRRNGSVIHDGEYHNSFMIRKDENVDNKLLMKILAIEGYHHGTYSCHAQNALGESEEYVNIMVKSKFLKYS